MAAMTDSEKPNWKILIEKRFNLYRAALQQDDFGLVVAANARDYLAGTDPKAAYFKEASKLGPEALELAEQQFEEIKDRVLATNEETKVNCDKIKASLEAVANGPDKDNVPAWKQKIKDNFKDLRAKTDQSLKNLEDWSIEKIEMMPHSLQDAAASSLNHGSNAIFTFVNSAVEWLKGAVDTVVQWFKQAWATIKSWATSVTGWFKTAWNTITSWFSLAGVPYLAAIKALNVVGSSETSTDYENLSRLLQNVGIDNFSLTRKNGSWLLQSM